MSLREGCWKEIVNMNPYEGERRLHQDVFERDERIQQMSLTIADLEGALTDRVNEIRELEDGRETVMNELDSMKRSERTREVVNQAFADSLTLVDLMMREN